MDTPDEGGAGFETGALRRLYTYGYDKARAGSFRITKLSQVAAERDAAKG